MQREVNKEIERERERQRGRDSRQTDWQTQFILVFQNSFSSVHGNPSYFSFYSLQNYYLVQTRLSQEMFCGSEFSASFVLSCPWHYCILKAHHHGLTFQWPNFHPVIGQCLPHKNCPVCNPFLVQTPVCLLLSVSCSLSCCLNFCSLPSLRNTSFSLIIRPDLSMLTSSVFPESSPLQSGSLVPSNKS